MALPFRPIVVLVPVLAFGISGATMLMRFVVSYDTGSAQIHRGQRLYAQHCASCHGADLQGEPDWQTHKSNGRMPAPPHDASGHTWHHSDRDLRRMIKHGMAAIVSDHESDMPAFEGVLSDQEIDAVVAFIKSRWPARERGYQEQQSRGS